MDFIKTFLSNFSPSISSESISKFTSIISIKTFKKGEFTIKKGEIPKYFYILKTGIIRSYISNENGKEHTLTIYQPVSIAGSLTSLINQTPSPATYECLMDCVMLKVNYSDFIKLTKEDIHLSNLHSIVLEKVFIRTEKKLHEISLLSATERYKKLKKEIPNIENLIAQYHIASYLNITPVQLSRIRKEIYSK